jgi:hypothetical protein
MVIDQKFVLAEEGTSLFTVLDREAGNKDVSTMIDSLMMPKMRSTIGLNV